MSEPFLGEITIFAGSFSPRGWTSCSGQLLDIATNTALFALLGTTYGGDGRTTFALPDLRGRAVVGPGSGPALTPRSLGERGGTEQVTLAAGEIPSHVHAGDVGSASFGAQTGDADQHSPAGGTPAVPTLSGNPGLNMYSTEAPDTAIEGAVGAQLSAGNSTGGGGGHANMQPFLVMKYIIALVGVFPSRN